MEMPFTVNLSIEAVKQLSISELLDIIREKQAPAEEERFLECFEKGEPDKVVKISEYWEETKKRKQGEQNG